MYFPTLILMPPFEDLHRPAYRVSARSPQPARTLGRRTWSRVTQARTALRARSAVSARTAGAELTGARS